MTFRRWAWSPVLLALPLLAVACGGDDGAGTPPLDPAGELQTIASGTAARELLASMPLTPQEMGEIIPGQAWAECGMGSSEEEELPEGVVANRAVDICSEEASVSMLVVLYETADSASDAWKAAWEEPCRECGHEPFDAGDIGDEAQGIFDRPPDTVGVGVSLRVDRVVAEVYVPFLGTDDEGREAALQVAGKVAAKVEAAIRG